ncbi:MAG: trigger factor [Chthoniobacteraceae bacterium]
MNVQVESLPNCITTVRVEVPADKVAETRETITKDYLKAARIPGYRPGKAPRGVIEAKFKKQIREDLEKQLLQESTREVIKERKLRVLTVSEVEDVEITPENAMHFTATLVTAPEFELPEYKGIAVQVPSEEVTEDDIVKALTNLQDQYSDFNDAEPRALVADDFAVIDYTGTADGKPIHEVYPLAGKQLTSGEDFWIRLTPEAFLPGFSEKLAGANVGETREFQLEVPADFPVEAMRGSKLDYKVTIKGIKDKVTPELNDEFAAKLAPGKTLEDVRGIVKTELERQKKMDVERAKRDQIMQGLLSKIECELPQNLVRYETQRMVNELVKENQSRGVADEVLKENEQNLVGAASQGAKEKIKGQFVLLRVAEKENLTVTREEFQQRIGMMAMRYQMTPEKLIKELQKNNSLDQVHEEILTGKALDFLVANASVETQPAPVA